MSSYAISKITHAVVFISDGIFVGLKYAVPVLFVLWGISLFYQKLRLNLLKVSLQWLTIVGGVLFILAVGVNTSMVWFSGNEEERAMMIAFATGNNRYQFFTPIMNYGLLPLLLWFKALRKSIWPLMIIVSIWHISFYIADRMNLQRGFNPMEMEVTETIQKLLVFSLACICTYLVCRRRQTNKG